VSVLRDTGCSTVVVRESLVPSEMLTGEKRMCVLIDGIVGRTPVALIEIDTPYFTGSVKAICMKNPLYDIIVGNVDGAKAVCESTDTNEIGQAVTTRQQAKMKPTKPLRVAGDVDINVSSTELATVQADDNSLKKTWEKATEDSNSTVASDNSFFVQKGLLYHRKLSSRGLTTKQLVLPEKLSNRAMKLSHESPMGGRQGVFGNCVGNHKILRVPLREGNCVRDRPPNTAISRQCSVPNWSFNALGTRIICCSCDTWSRKRCC